MKQHGDIFSFKFVHTDNTLKLATWIYAVLHSLVYWFLIRLFKFLLADSSANWLFDYKDLNFLPWKKDWNGKRNRSHVDQKYSLLNVFCIFFHAHQIHLADNLLAYPAWSTVINSGADCSVKVHSLWWGENYMEIIV